MLCWSISESGILISFRSERDTQCHSAAEGGTWRRRQRGVEDHLRLWICRKEGAESLPVAHCHSQLSREEAEARRYQWSWLMPTWGSLIYNCDRDGKSTLAKMIHAARTINLFPRWFLNARAPPTSVVVTGESMRIENNLSFSLHSLE